MELNNLHNLVLTSCSFELNSAINSVGGALAILEDVINTTISDSIFISNRGRRGGAILTSGDILYMRNVEMTENVASESGGGIYLSSISNGIIRDSIFSQNEAIHDGGGLYLNDNTEYVKIVGSSMSKNIARREGGGFYASSSVFGFVIIDTDSYSHSTIFESGHTYWCVESTDICSSPYKVNYNESYSVPDGYSLMIAFNKSTIIPENQVFTVYQNSSKAVKLYESIGDHEWPGVTANVLWIDGNTMYYEFTNTDVPPNNLAVFGFIMYVYAVPRQIPLTPCNSEIRENKASVGGGGRLAFAVNSFSMLGTCLEDNYAANEGGGIFFDSYCAAATISSCSFIGQHSSEGPAISINSANYGVQILRSSFMYNHAKNGGGAMKLSYGNGYGTFPHSNRVLIENCSFDSNFAYTVGGVLYVFSNNYLVTKSSTFTNNSAVEIGGVISSYEKNTIEIDECIFSSNLVGIDGGVLHLNLQSKSIISNSRYL